MYWTVRTAALAVLGLPLVVLWPRWATVIGWLVFVVAAAMADVALAPGTRAVAAERAPTAPIRLGDRAASAVRLTTTGRRARLWVRDVWQPLAGAASDPVALRLAPGAGADLTTWLEPRRRGAVRAHRLVLRSRGPLGLGGRQAAREVPGEVTVLPAFPSRRSLPGRLARLRELDGRAAVRTRGPGTDFDSLRDYVRGDDVRSIDWRASARGAGLVVRTWRPERDRHVVLAVDTGRLSAGRVGDRPRLDAAMDAALLLGAVAARAGDRVTLVCLDSQVRVRTRPDARRVVADLSEALAPVRPCLAVTDWSALLPCVGHGALVVLLTPLEAAPAIEDLVPFVAPLTRGHRVVVASVADPAVAAMARTGALAGDARPSVRDRLHAMAAAERTWLDNERARAGLARAGATVLDEPPDRLPTVLVDHYLWLKHRGRL